MHSSIYYYIESLSLLNHSKLRTSTFGAVSSVLVVGNLSFFLAFFFISINLEACVKLTSTDHAEKRQQFKQYLQLVFHPDVF